MQDYFVMIALVLVVLVNNLIGSMSALIEGKFDKSLCKKGLLKGLLVGLCGVGLYGAGCLTPEISVGLFNGIELTLTQAINALVSGGFIYYAYQDIIKIKDLIGIKIQTEELIPEVDEVSSAQRGN